MLLIPQSAGVLAKNRGGHSRLSARSVEPKAREWKNAQARRHRGGHHRGRGTQTPAKANDGVRCPSELGPHPLGKQNRFGRHEADCRTPCGRNDYFDHPRVDSRARFLRVDEGARAQTRDASLARQRVREGLMIR